MSLSLVIPTFNEEKNIRYPLDSAYDLVDEIIIIDAGSTDKTVEIATSYGEKVQVFVVDNPQNFLINKQRGIEKAKGEWILQLDADEALTKELKSEIKTVISQSQSESALRIGGSVKSVKTDSTDLTNLTDSTVSGFYIPRKNWFLTRFLMKGGVYPDYVLRLYKREKAKFDLKDVHENVKIEGEVGHLKNAIEHYSDPDFERYLTRWNRYTTFEAEKLYKEGKKLHGINYIIIKPKLWFLMTYFRHKGFLDGFPGFIFSLFSSLRFVAIYVKWWTKKSKKS